MLDHSLERDKPNQDEQGSLAGLSPCCEKCGAVGQDTTATWCQKCGYYAVIGKCLSLSEEDRQERGEASPAPQAAPSYFGIFKMIPAWIWGLFGLIVLLLASSLAANLLLPKGSNLLMVWSVSQLGIGLTIFSAAHILAYLNAMLEDSSINFSDLFLRPLVIWGPTLARLPASSRRVQAALFGIGAAFFSIVIVGGLPYHLLWSWGPDDNKADPNLLAAVAQMAPEQADNGGDLSDAIEDFADQAGASQDLLDPEGEEGDAAAGASEAEAPKKEIDCLVLGYRPQGEDDFSSLIIVGEVQGSIRVIGTVSEGISPEEKGELFERMQKIRRSTPFIPSGMEAIWLEPVLLCKVHFSKWSPQHWLEEPIFARMLDERGPVD